jgi:phosphate/sulfate permease
MKPWLASITGGIIGAAIALYLAQVFWMRAFRIAIPDGPELAV